MRFGEKLDRLTAHANKSKIAIEAGLPATAISDYINKGNVPRSDKALVLARALKVPLEWLVDDTQGFPLPTRETYNASSLSDDALLLEVARRYRLDMLRWQKVIREVEAVDWSREASQEDAIKLLGLVFDFSLYKPWNVEKIAALHHASMPGSDQPVDEISAEKLFRRRDAILANPDVHRLLSHFTPKRSAAEIRSKPWAGVGGSDVPYGE